MGGQAVTQEELQEVVCLAGRAAWSCWIYSCLFPPGGPTAEIPSASEIQSDSEP